MFTEYNFWSLVPVLATHAGAIAGAWTYRITVQAHWYQGDIQLDQQDAHVKNQRQMLQPSVNPAYDDTRPHTPDDEKYQPLHKHLQPQTQNGLQK